MVRNKYALLILLGIILASILSGCSTGTTTTPQTSSTFSSIEELALFVQAHSSGDTMGGRALAEPAMMLESRAVSDSVGSSAPDFSQTNNQVASVDEADVIKTDGLYIYTITDNTIFIVVAGDNPEIVATFDVEFQPSELFIVNDKLFVIGNQYDNVMFRSYPRSNAFSVVAIYDVSDRSIPSLDKTFEFEGMYFRGRMKGDYVYIVTNTLFDMRPIPMPIIMENGMQTRVGLSNVRRLADSYDNPSFVTIHAINTRNLELDSLSVIAESAHNMYMSENNIYLLHTNYINEYEIQRDLFLKETESLLNSEDISLIAEIRSINPLILSRWEKERKIEQVHYAAVARLSIDEQEDLTKRVENAVKETMAGFDYLEHTIMHKIAIDGSTMNHVTSGEVPGSIVNQFSLDEYDGILRIATTLNPRWSRFENHRSESENMVFTLSSNLEILDSIKGIAPTERIFSARFVEDRLYMVTFRDVDPFYVIDLSNPENIEILGELKIPGFSNYLHPFDENTIIGFGRDVSEDGVMRGLKISLFDVSDVTNPLEKTQFVTGSRYAHSVAQFEHRAFLFSKEQNLLVVPAYAYNWRDPTDESYNGAFVFNITADSITLRGLIDHGSESMYMPLVERSLYIDNILYTKSRSLLRANRLEDLSSVANISLRTTRTDIPIY